MNATLAAWLGYDLASVGPGGPHLTEIAPEADVLVRTAGLPGEVRTDRFDLDLRRRNGHTLPVRLYHRVAFGKDGKPGSSRTFVINRSAGAETDEPQRAAEVRLARFLNNSPIAIATLDSSGRIARANASFTRLFGTVPRQVDDGAPDGEGVPRVEPNVADSVADRTALEAGLARAASGRTDPEPIEVQLNGPGGRSARVWLSPADGGDPGQQTDEAERVILYALDTTAQRQLEQQVAQAQKMNAVGQLAGGIAHDFNNVLQAIIGYSDLLLASHRPTDPAFQDIMQIKQNATRAATLVRVAMIPEVAMGLGDVALVAVHLREAAGGPLAWLEDADALPGLSLAGRESLRRLRDACGGFEARAHPWNVASALVLDRLGIARRIGGATTLADRMAGVAVWQFLNFLRSLPIEGEFPTSEVSRQIRRLIRLNEERSLRQFPDAALERTARLCLALGTDGLRGELTLMRTARALAALDGAGAVTDDHLRRIAPAALRHRLRRNPLDESGSTARVERALAEVFA